MAQQWSHKPGVSANFHGYPGTTMQVQAADAFAVGDLIVVLVSAASVHSNMNVINVTDQLGNAYSSPTNGFKQYDAGGGGGSTSAVGAIYLSVCSVAGIPQITAQLTRTPDWGAAMGVDGFQGVSSTVDASAVPATGVAGATPSTNTSGATTGADDLALAAYMDLGGTPTLITVPFWTAGVKASGTNDNNFELLYQNSGAAGSTMSAGNPTAGGPNNNWVYFLVILAPAALIANEALGLTDSAAVTVLGGTTPTGNDSFTLTDYAQVTIVGDPALPPGWGQARAPSWDIWHPPLGRYTFYCERLDQPGAILATPPLSNVSWTRLINQPGSFKASLKLSDLSRFHITLDQALAATEPRQTICHIDRGGTIVGHGCILTRKYDLATDSLELGGQDLLYWLSKRVISQDLTYVNKDQLQVQRDLLTYTQTRVNGNLSIVADNSVTSDVLISRTYLAVQGTQAAGSGTADSGNLLTAMQNIAVLNNGFEFRIRTHWAGNRIERRLEQAYPRFGVSAQVTPYVWAYPGGAIKSADWPEDGTPTITKVYVLGNQQNDGTRPVAISSDPPAYPLTEETVTYGVDDLASLQRFADARESVLGSTLVIPEIVVYGHFAPVFGTYFEGDHARFKVRAGTTGRWPLGTDQAWRIIGLDISLSEEGLEDVKHILAGAA